jgi:hypothetical protein
MSKPASTTVRAPKACETLSVVWRKGKYSWSASVKGSSSVTCEVCVSSSW